MIRDGGMTSLPRFLTVAPILASFLYGQSLRVPPSATDRKSPGVFSLVLEAPSGKTPVALQWDFLVPPALAIAKEDISIGKAAQTANKLLTCAISTGKSAIPGGVRYTCILAGGQDAIEPGPIAKVQYRAQADVQGAPIRVTIEKVLGVSVDLKRIEIPNAEAIINIR